jgi:hypothetical protein
VQRIVQRHGGQISAMGQAGQGAVFEFTLGQREAMRPDPAAAAGEPITVPGALSSPGRALQTPL